MQLICVVCLWLRWPFETLRKQRRGSQCSSQANKSKHHKKTESNISLKMSESAFNMCPTFKLTFNSKPFSPTRHGKEALVRQSCYSLQHLNNSTSISKWSNWSKSMGLGPLGLPRTGELDAVFAEDLWDPCGSWWASHLRQFNGTPAMTTWATWARESSLILRRHYCMHIMNHVMSCHINIISDVIVFMYFQK